MQTLTLLLALSVAILPAQEKDQGKDVEVIVAECINLINSDEWEVRDKGAQRLVELGKEAIPPLRKLLAEKGDTLPRKDLVVEVLEDLEMDLAESAIKKLFTEDGGVGSFAGQCKPVLEELGDEAEGVLSTLVKSPVRTARNRVLAARALGELGKESAIKVLKEVWNDEYEDDDVKEEAAFALDRLGDGEALKTLAAKAEAELAEAELQERPYEIRSLVRMLNVWRHKKEYDKVLDIYSKWEKLQPTNSNVDYNRACTYAVMGKKKEALDALELAIKKGYRDYKWMEMDGDMNTLRDDKRYKAIMKDGKGEGKEDGKKEGKEEEAGEGGTEEGS